MATYTAASSGVWYTWVDGDSTTATNSSSGNTWNQWVTGTDFSSTTAASTNVWMVWNDGRPEVYQYQPAEHRYTPYTPPPETEEQKQARLARDAEFKRQEEERKRKEAEALQRAEDLLILHLNAKQQKDWKDNKAFDVISQSGKRFRIKNNRSHNVDEYDADGKKIYNHCIVAPHHVPLPDQFVMQMLMLEHHEADFMRIANHQRIN